MPGRKFVDIILKLISKSSFSRKVTIKGGVVMRDISGDVRRATQDVDLDFIKYSLSEESVLEFIKKINVLEEFEISAEGSVEELKHQDYHGKRVYVRIRDLFGNEVFSKIDIGVHKNFEIEQEEYCFSIDFSEDGASLLINSKEQMFTEKLRAILKFGVFSTRYKDVYDLHFLAQTADREKLKKYIQMYIFNDEGMKEENMEDVCRRIEKTFFDKRYLRNISTSRKNWLDVSNEEVLQGIIDFLYELKLE